MTDRLVYLPLTASELEALNAWHVDGGVIGEEQERLLNSALRKLRACAAR